MTSVDPFAYTAAHLADPTVDAWTLAQISANRPDLHRFVLVHPNCYPALAAWIMEQSGSSPSHVPRPEGARTGSVQASGQPWPEMVMGPSSTGTARPPSPGRWLIGPGITAAAGFVALLSLFMPAATTVFGYSVDFFSDGGDGVILLVLFLVVIGCSIGAMVVRHMAVGVTTAVVGILSGLAGLMDGFLVMINVVGEEAASVGVGALLLTVASVALVAGSVAILIIQQPRREQRWPGVR